MIDYKHSEPMKYFAAPPAMTPDVKRMKLENMIDSGEYMFGRKYDGNWSRAVIETDSAILQTRGISKTTGTYGEIQDKVLFWDDVCNAFTKGTTVILGEVYLPGGIDKDCGAVESCSIGGHL